MQALRTLLGCTAVMVLFCTAAHADSDLSGLADMIKARTDYQRMLTERKIAESTINLQNAQARYDNEKTEQLAQLLVVLRHEYDRILKEESEMDRQVAELRRRIVEIAPLRSGHVTGAVLAAFNFFVELTLSAEQMRDTIFKKVDPLGVENFVANQIENDVDLVPFPGGNVGTLLKFMGQHEFSFAQWSTGHSLVLDLIGAISKSGEEKLDKYQRYMDGIRSGTLPIWQLPQT